ncbi:MAG TPA: sugar phosphate isomerase/epimerase [Planctomycetaceae bacterium]|nr:sugar phosphate isomerase/epimerase [Planctomycetaceae bacterium]
MFVAASTRCFADHDVVDACRLIADLEYDKVEFWLDESSEHLKPSTLVGQPETFITHFHDAVRLTPVAIHLEHDVDLETFTSLVRFCKRLRITQFTVPASPLGTPFNAEIDRLRDFLRTAGQEGIRVSIKTKTGDLTEDIHTAVELCQAVKGLGLTLDPSYYICGSHRNAPLEIAYPYVYHVHLRDTSEDAIQVPTGLGEVDYTRLIGQLRRHDYHRILSVDLFPDQLAGTDRALEMRKLRMLLETLL